MIGYAANRLKPRSLLEVERHLRKHWAPLKGSSLASIRRAHVAARLGELAADNGPFAANRARAALSALYSWAIGEGLADENPVAGTHRPTEEVSRDRVLTDAELRLVWRQAGSGDFGAILRLLILTAARREEIGGLMRSEIQGGVLRVSANRSKNRRQHDIPLSSQAAAIIHHLPRRDDRELVFGTRAGPFQGWSNSKSELDARMLAASKADQGEKAKLVPWRLHDVRRTAATRIAELGVQPHIVEAILGHVSGFRAGVAGIYNRATYLKEKKSALQLWGNRVADIVGDQ